MQVGSIVRRLGRYHRLYIYGLPVTIILFKIESRLLLTMRFSIFALVATTAVAFTIPVEDLVERTDCSCSVRKAAVYAELKTIASHTAADAAKIPLNPLASRSFYVTCVFPGCHLLDIYVHI